MFMDGFNKIPIRSEEELRIEIPKEKSLSVYFFDFSWIFQIL